MENLLTVPQSGAVQPTMTCSHCNTKLFVDETSCVGCGYKVKPVKDKETAEAYFDCARCGVELKPLAANCSNCHVKFGPGEPTKRKRTQEEQAYERALSDIPNLRQEISGLEEQIEVLGAVLTNAKRLQAGALSTFGDLYNRSRDAELAASRITHKGRLGLMQKEMQERRVRGLEQVVASLPLTNEQRVCLVTAKGKGAGDYTNAMMQVLGSYSK